MLTRRRAAADAIRRLSDASASCGSNRHDPKSAIRHPRFRRPRLARNLQQPAGQHRRADGRHAPQHGQQREREGAARFQLRDFHGRRPARGQCAARAGAPGRDGRNRSAHDRGQSGLAAGRRDSPRTIRTPAARICRTSPSSRRCTTRRGELLFFTANRAHHAEIGGIAPGSMPPLSKNLAEEGVLIRNLENRGGGRIAVRRAARRCCCPARIRRATSRRIWPTSRRKWPPIGKARTILLALVDRYSWPVVRRTWIMSRMRPSERCGRRSRGCRPGTHAFTDYLETADGASVPICVRFTIHGARQHAGRDDRLHRHRAGRRRQSQRQSGDRHGGRDLRAAAAGRRRHSAQPRRAAADRDRAARRAC